MNIYDVWDPKELERAVQAELRVLEQQPAPVESMTPEELALQYDAVMRQLGGLDG